MGQNGLLTFYRTARPDDPKQMLRDLLELARPEKKPLVSRTLVEDREYERYVRDDFEDTPWEFFNDRLELAEIPDAFVENRSLHVGSIVSHLGRQIATGVENAIPESIRGNFVPGEIGITIGCHDIWENAESEEGFLFARAFLSIAFFGYGSPNIWPAFRAAVFAIPEVQAVKHELETFAGGLEECIYWSV